MNRRQLRSNRFLPQYVTRFVDRHGKERLRFRRKGFPAHYFKAPLGTEEFRAEYAACMNPERIAEAVRARAAQNVTPGSLDDLLSRYFSVPGRLGPTEQTQRKVRAVLERFREGRGDRPVVGLTFEHIDAIIARRRVKVQIGTRWEGGVEAARKLRKELVRLFDFAKKIGMVDGNPARDADRVKVAPGDRSKGFYSWTEEDIATFRAHHPIGTKPRLAMELMLWTDQRRVDSIHLGRQHITNGSFHLTQSKTGRALWIPVAPQLLEAIVAMPPNPNAMCFLVNDYGRPFTNAGFGNWFRAQCDAAGLPQCTAHGLRKATMRRMAELDFSNQTMKSVSGHIEDDEVALYTASASQKAMAADAIRRLSAWETSNLGPRLDASDREAAGE